MQLNNDKHHSVSPDMIDADSEPTKGVDNLEELCKNFVGELDLPESMHPNSPIHIFYANQCI